MIRYFFFLNLLGLIWFWGLMPPWQGWIESDNAIPYLMVHEPWHLQDFYYWGQMRFGSVFVVAWKLLIQPFHFGPQAFYLGHALLFFNGMAFWLLCFCRIEARIAFAALMLPLSVSRTTLFLLPGQPYGMLFLIQGAYFFLLLHGRRNRALGWGVLSGLAYWQHELAGLGLLAMGVYFLRYETTPYRWRPFLAGCFPWLVLSEVARQWSKQWPVVHHYSLNQWPAFVENVWFFVAQGLPLFSSPALAWLVWWGWLVLWVATLARPASAHAHSGTERLLRVLPVGILFWLAAVLDSRWYSLNARHPRYLTLVWPAVLFWLVLRADSTGEKTWLGRAARAIVAAAVLIFYLSPVGLDLLGREQKPLRAAHYLKDRALLDAIEADGCKSFVGPYWEATPLMVFSAGTLKVGSPDYTRNPVLLEKSIKSEDSCFSRQTLSLVGERNWALCSQREKWVHCP